MMSAAVVGHVLAAAVISRKMIPGDNGPGPGVVVEASKYLRGSIHGGGNFSLFTT